MRKVLVMASGFPPQGGGGVTRVHSFVKYLPRFGWQPIVLTLKEEYAYSHSLDHDMLRVYDDCVEIHRTKSFEPPRTVAGGLRQEVTGFGSQRSLWAGPLRTLAQALYALFLIPDEKILWLPWAVRTGRGLVSSKGIDLIFCTTPPHSVSIIGTLLKEVTNTPCIWDVRDDWVGNPYFARKFPHRTYLESLMESKAAFSSDGIVVVTPESQRFMTEKYPSLSERVHLIPNGFDPEVFRLAGEGTQQQSSKCRIIYSGSLTRRRDIAPFLEAIAELEETDSISDGIEVLFVGSVHHKHSRLIDHLDLEHMVKLIGQVSQQQSIEYLLSADVCLLISTSQEGAQTAIPSKIYEYIGAQKFVLALAGSDSAAASLVREGDLGMIVCPGDKEAIQLALRKILKLCGENELREVKLSPQWRAQFDRIALTKELSEVFDLTLTRSRSQRA